MTTWSRSASDGFFQVRATPVAESFTVTAVSRPGGWWSTTVGAGAGGAGGAGTTGGAGGATGVPVDEELSDGTDQFSASSRANTVRLAGSPFGRPPKLQE